jgi:hypothetical protein
MVIAARERNFMRVKAAFLFAAVALASLAVKTPAGFRLEPPKTALPEGSDLGPVVLELFTSEGCSSCPPADAFLKQLDDAGHVNEVEIIAIEEHVDYWDSLGWRDPFSSHDWTARQEDYARSLGHDGIYTPQLVVNGRRDLVGSSSREARQDIVEASKIPNASLRFSTVDVSAKSAEFSISIENAPPEARSARLLIAVTERGLASNVLRGENEGRNLSHAPVLRSLTNVQIPKGNSSGLTEVKATVHLDPSWKRENLRFVAFLQDPDSLHILGAAASTVATVPR